MSPAKVKRTDADLRADLVRVSKGRAVIALESNKSTRYGIMVRGFGEVARALWRAWIKRGWLTDVGDGRFEVQL